MCLLLLLLTEVSSAFDETPPRRSTGRIGVQVPEDCRAGQSSKWFGYYQPASNVAPGPFADREACADSVR